MRRSTGPELNELTTNEAAQGNVEYPSDVLSRGNVIYITAAAATAAAGVLDTASSIKTIIPHIGGGYSIRLLLLLLLLLVVVVVVAFVSGIIDRRLWRRSLQDTATENERMSGVIISRNAGRSRAVPKDKAHVED